MKRVSAWNSAIFQAGGLIVVVVEVTRKAFLASLVPVIVDAILNEHQIVADIVAFVPRTDFPRSRLGEKQRGKILAAWVTRRLHTIAQFSIRDPEATTNQLADTHEQYRNSRASKPASLMGNSARRNTLVENSNNNNNNEQPGVPASVEADDRTTTPTGSMSNSQGPPPPPKSLPPNPPVPPHPEAAAPPPPPTAPPAMVVSSEEGSSVLDDSFQDGEKALSFRFHEPSTTVHNPGQGEVPSTVDTRREGRSAGTGVAF